MSKVELQSVSPGFRYALSFAITKRNNRLATAVTDEEVRALLDHIEVLERQKSAEYDRGYSSGLSDAVHKCCPLEE